MNDRDEVVIIDNEYVTMKCLPKKGLLYHTLHKPVPDAHFKETLMTALDVMKKYGVSKWLTDDRLGGPLSDDFRDWARTAWQGQMVEAGWRFWAMVVPTSVIGASTLMDPFEEIHNRGVRIAAFSEVGAALEWLESVD